MELHELVTVFLLSDDRRGELSAAEGQFGAGMGLPSRLREAFPDAVSLVLEQQHLNGAAGRLPMAQQPCREHAGVVHHQTVARLQQVDQIIKMPVLHRAGALVQHQQAGAVPPLQRRLRDQFFRQIIVKIMSFQQTTAPSPR